MALSFLLVGPADTCYISAISKACSELVISYNQSRPTV